MSIIFSSSYIHIQALDYNCRQLETVTVYKICCQDTFIITHQQFIAYSIIEMYVINGSVNLLLWLG